MKRDNRKQLSAGLKILVFLILVVLLLMGCWSIAFYLTRWGFSQLDWHPNAWVQQIMNSVLGFLLFGGGISVVSPFMRKKQVAFFQSMLDALKRISQGDYRIQITIPNLMNDEPFLELAKSINDMAADLEKLENMRQEFISNVSHEIQSPLTSIGGFARILKNDELDREQRAHYLDIIEQESIRLSNLSENMLRLASLDSDKHPFRPQSFRLDKQLQSVIVACEPQWLEKELEILVDVAPAIIEADQDLLSQVWVNLLHNAIKFTTEGGSITVRLEQHDAQVVVQVIDTGIGISEDDLQHIFERFYKADKSRTRTTGGSGLGLSIIHKVVEMHHGSIQVASKLNKGTQVTVTLPLGYTSSVNSTDDAAT